MENENGKKENNVDYTKDVQDNKGMAMVAYIIFFIPLLAAKESKFAKFHANQGLNVLLLSLAVSILGSFIPYIGWIISAGGSVACIVFIILGIVNASNGEMKELPLIGKINIIK